MKTILKMLGNLLLFLLAPLLFLVLMPINVAVVFGKDWHQKGFKNAVLGLVNYFKESAVRLDKYACSEYRTLWNLTLKTKKGNKMGVNGRTLSADLGEQEISGTMSKTGAILNLILFLIERNHCRKAYGK